MTGLLGFGAAVVLTGTVAEVLDDAAVVADVVDEAAVVVPPPDFLLLPHAATIKATPTMPTPTNFPGLNRA